jgi:small-conductance mechanosensitive channel
MDIQQAINLELYRRFEDAGIAFAFPTGTLYFSETNLAEARNDADVAADRTH